MRIPKFSNKSRLLVLFMVLLVGLATVLTLSTTISQNIEQGRKSKLEKVNSRASTEFSRSLDRFVLFVAGIRSYLSYAEEFPTQEELFQFVQLRRKQLNYTDELIVSFIDTSHFFQYSFDHHRINPSGLVGLNVGTFRDSASMRNIERVLKDEEYHLFAPANLVEGWVGIPLHFSIRRDNNVVGYIAAIANFKSIIDPIYEMESADEVVFNFSAKGLVFDREQVHDGTKVHHERQDSLFFKNFHVDASQYIYSEFDVHELKFRIGSAFSEPDPLERRLQFLLYGWYIIVGTFVVYAIYGFNKFRTLNSHLEGSLVTIRDQKKQIDDRNRELNHLNQTKDKFFSVLSHDMRSPISSISGLVHLLQKDQKEENKVLIHNLRQTTDEALALLENVLQWSLANTETIKLNIEEVDCEPFLADILSQFKGVTLTRGIELLLQVESGLKLQWDKNIVSVVLRNLVSNAIKVSPDGSKVVVDLNTMDDKALLGVIDGGPGLTEAEYLQLTNIKTRTNTGLGLILVNDFAAMHGGGIKVSSNEPRGAKIEFIIPFLD